ncbi:3-methyl-2-oxobutanoate hydroxymethyltransferase [Polystyrenella longa]|uniref:3-methyl-2-oxobutanoate hydroxymethyltransferase n=1 Tax=Polystyrenella longa TaxID=2528007 RepID=A0A518CR80_9PLAN|nr:3-methyl-2-oxobutanoate hydroxymethyltransferase [Polystyrenella longa]QDU81718.1 3-methyl-2-oxobutanoate hydroxymethyltransferase [Polystyrenella longa]
MTSNPNAGSPRKKMTLPRFLAQKEKGKKITMVTAYDYLWAQLFDEAGVDSILVGDSLGMVVQGRQSTVPVTLDQIIYHGEMVVRAVKNALVIVDMPFMSYEVSPQEAIRNAGRILKETGATAVKLEGGESQAETIRALARSELAVMAHVGMKPQSHQLLGGMGRIQRNEAQLIADAKAAEEAGAFGIVLELIPADLAQKVTDAISIPTIGIGAGPHCDGQVLVSPDMLGLTPGFQPRFLKHFANLRDAAIDGTRSFIDEVESGQYPDASHSHE